MRILAARGAVKPRDLNCNARESRDTAAIFLKHKQEQRVDKSYQRTATVGESKYTQYSYYTQSNEDYSAVLEYASGRTPQSHV